MTTTTTTRDFVRRLRRSELMELDSLRKSLAAIQTKHGGQLPEDVKVLAEDLIGGGAITQWQAKNLLSGRWKGFFLGKYKLLRQLGVGGMSAVFLAEHAVMRRRVAIKVLPRRRLSNPLNLSRFQQEARTCAMLNHPNVVQVIDFDRVDDQHFMVMEFVDGMDLQRLVQQQGPLRLHRVLEYLRCSASGLQHAHERGIIHRDIKPLNILIHRDGVLKISDLGLARLRYDEDPSLSGETPGVLGTADYVAPEQIRASHLADGRSDLYSLGCTLYFMLTGRAPFAQGTVQERIARHQTMPPPDPRKLRSDCPTELAEICMRLMAKSPEDRYPTATLLLQAIDRVQWNFTSSGVPISIPEHSPQESLSSIVTDSNSGSSAGGAHPVSDSPFDDFSLSNTSDDGSDASLDDLLTGIDLPTVMPATAANFQSLPAASAHTFASAVTVPKPKSAATDASQNKTIIYAGIGMAAFAVVFSVVMSIVFVFSPEDKGRGMIKRSEGGKTGNVVIIGN
ncbi:Serine/threonine-protein kinase PknB [Rosistilla carotiformis]|uniref:Serine/threonine-protein kinase PknB n=1 Tax=Rosistilla carotiformis TaxID=2528017 RepID=A0A518JWZ4_9BACT|nr:serine/threonine-protein kinase [Rosistilla carotiformis]QDV70070.1 Serine/threonine-protein kinase PknB [Rosistilla carotiformis]